MKHRVIKHDIITTSLSDANQQRFVVVHCGSHINSSCGFIKQKISHKIPRVTEQPAFRANPGQSRASGFYVLCINRLWLFKCWKSMNSSSPSAPRGFLISLALLWPRQLVLKRCVCNWQQELRPSSQDKEITRFWIWSLIQRSVRSREECPLALTFLCLCEYIPLI